MRLLAAFLVLFGSSPAFASHEDVGFGARAGAMGDAFSAVGDDLTSVAYNPAGLGTIPYTEVNGSFRRAFQIPSGMLNYDSTAFGAAVPVESWPLKGAVAVHATQTGVADVSLDRSVGLTYATRGWKETGPGVLDYGITLRSLGRSARGRPGSVTKAGVDLGALYRIGDSTRFGFSVLNVNGPRTEIGGIPDRAPVIAKLGAAQAVRGFTLALDLSKREPSGTFGATNTLALGMERWLQTLRFGAFALRGGISLSDKSKAWGMGWGWKVLGGQLDHAVLVPLATGSRWGNAVTLTVRFGSWNPDKEYERILGAEIRYRRDLTRALEAAEVRQWKLAEELRRMRTALDELKGQLARKSADAQEAQAEARENAERLNLLQERQKAAEKALEDLENEKNRLRNRTKESLFREEWLAYQKLKLQGTPDVVLLERVKNLLREYKDSGVDLGEAHQELQRLLRSR